MSELGKTMTACFFSFQLTFAPDSMLHIFSYLFSLTCPHWQKRRQYTAWAESTAYENLGMHQNMVTFKLYGKVIRPAVNSVQYL